MNVTNIVKNKMFIIDNDNSMKSKIMDKVNNNPNNNSILNCLFHDN